MNDVLEVKDRKFKDKAEREKVNNRFLLLGTTVFYALFLGFTTKEFLDKSLPTLIAIPIMLCSIVPLIVNWIFYFKNSYGDKFKWVCMTGFMIAYSALLLGGGSNYIQLTTVGVMMGGVLYFDVKFTKIYAIVAGFINIGYMVLITLQKQENLNQQYAEALILMLMFFTAYKCTEIGYRYTHDALHAVMDEQKIQSAILDEVLEIAEIVQEGATKSNQLIHDLEESTGVVNSAVTEISESTQMTAENIQEQTIMTQSIQKSIHDTVERSDKIVNIAKESTVTIQKSIQVMSDLKAQSETIATTNSDVVHSMEKLQEKTKEVHDIASIIFSISSQTNLLALNASIESARAGEAGRGFAVVAEQIRELAEQTRKSTENISKIIEALNANAEEASEIIVESIVAADTQGRLIATASQNFEKINKDVSVLTDDIGEIDKMLANLADANNRIVENISQLSASTEEVTASSQEAATISEKNLKEADHAKGLLEEVIATSKRLDKYIEKKHQI